ncbi:ras-associated and pleckstrin homology domains-containing protein 1-like [Scylla paramamosain]|uniref:ras-associated and pleckstrin homology domains-containing protein 1-like n=1 Tax=Scylla paramamosain TaxID=85552 RepID=UPI0030830C64
MGSATPSAAGVADLQVILISYEFNTRKFSMLITRRSVLPQLQQQAALGHCRQLVPLVCVLGGPEPPPPHPALTHWIPTKPLPAPLCGGGGGLRPARPGPITFRLGAKGALRLPRPDLKGFLPQEEEEEEEEEEKEARVPPRGTRQRRRRAPRPAPPGPRAPPHPPSATPVPTTASVPRPTPGATQSCPPLRPLLPLKQQQQQQQQPQQVYSWPYPPQPQQFQYPYDAAEGTDTATTTTTTATTRVIQVLPQYASTPQPHSPMTVQAGNVIQVVPGRWRWATHTWVTCGLADLPPPAGKAYQPACPPHPSQQPLCRHCRKTQST